MIDFKEFFAYLNGRKKFIFLIPLVCVVLTFFFVRNLPDNYRSQTQISTGLTDQSQQVEGQGLDYNRTNQQFGNIVEMITMRQVIDKLTYKLILHDLENPAQPFKPYSETIEKLTPEQLKKAISEFKDRLYTYKSISLDDNRDIPLFDIVKYMGYDQESLMDDLTVQRNGESDFVEIAFESENPELSAFVVNTLSMDFISYYTRVTSTNEKRTVALLDSLLQEKQRVMNERNAALKNYKLGSGVMNLDAQSEILFKQISDYEGRLSQTTSEIASLEGAINRIKNKLGNKDDTDLSSGKVAENNELVNLENQLRIANQQYVQNNFRPEDKSRVDSLQSLRASKMAASVNVYASDPKANRQSLVDERMGLETKLALAQNSVASISNELSALRGRYNAMAPADANLQNLQRDAEVANTEYLEALNRFNQTNVEKSTSVRLNIVEAGLPGLAQPSKKAIYLALSGFASLFAVLTALLIAYLLDNSVKTSAKLSQVSGIPVLGNLNHIVESNKDLRDIWEDGETVSDYSLYKDLIRSLRFEINKILLGNGEKVLGITSLANGDGKTFIASSLAYAFALIGKKVLLIGEDYPNLLDLISNKAHQPKQQFETFLVKKVIKTEDLITVLNRNPKKSSLLEIKDSNNLIAGFEILRKEFDIIIIDINSLHDVNHVKEWLMFTDKSLAVFKCGNKVVGHDSEVFKSLKQQPGFLGWIFNDVRIGQASGK